MDTSGGGWGAARHELKELLSLLISGPEPQGTKRGNQTSPDTTKDMMTKDVVFKKYAYFNPAMPINAQ